MEAYEEVMKKIKLVLSALFLTVGFLVCVFVIFPEKYNKAGFKSNAENFLENGGLLRGTEDLKLYVTDYGDAEFKGRKVKGALVRAKYILIDRREGVKEEKCLFIPALYDKEFEVYRAMTLIDCEDAYVIGIPEWKSQFKLNGYVYQEDPGLVKSVRWKQICQSRELPGRMEYKKVTLSNEQEVKTCDCIRSRNPVAVDEMVAHPGSTYPLARGDGSGTLLTKYVEDIFICIKSPS